MEKSFAALPIRMKSECTCRHQVSESAPLSDQSTLQSTTHFVSKRPPNLSYSICFRLPEWRYLHCEVPLGRIILRQQNCEPAPFDPALSSREAHCTLTQFLAIPANYSINNEATGNRDLETLSALLFLAFRLQQDQAVSSDHARLW